LTTPAGVIMMLAGFRSRWMMPFVVRGFERVCDLPGVVESSLERQRSSESVSPGTNSITSARALSDPSITIDLRNVGMIQRREHLGFTLEARETLGIFGEGRGQNFDRYFAIQLGVARLDTPRPCRPRPMGARIS
jgi:hypothetical protein